MAAQPIRWGILSTARIGLTRFIPGVRKARNSVVMGIASRDGARAEAAAAQLGIPHAHASYESLLADPEIDAIYNPLPNSMHLEWTLKAAEAGKAILCEKPLAVDASDAAAMVEGCRRHSVLLMEAFMYRLHPQHARVRALLDAGSIGELRGVRSAFTFLMDPLDPSNIRLRSDVAGGSLMDVGCYSVNAMRMLFGEEPTAAQARFDFRAEFGVDVTMAGILQFSDGRFGSFDCGFRAAGQGWYMVAGSQGTIMVPSAFVPGTADTLVILTTNEERISGVDQYTLEAEEFADCLLQGRAPSTPPEDGVANMRVIEALYRSAHAGGASQDI